MGVGAGAGVGEGDVVETTDDDDVLPEPHAATDRAKHSITGSENRFRTR